jgi:asparagine synthase (glutamine-hydrolysing)
MCGIAGIFKPSTNGHNEVNLGWLKAMTDAISHRGPDADGHHIEPFVGLGHRRLSIIDVTSGKQPLFNEDGTVSVSYNGEIYNYQELVNELKLLGHVFKTNSDTEVIVHAWEQWGTECLDRFRGMFAFALWDRNQRCLFLARDRLGVKPIYYAVSPKGDLVFASEIKAILQHPEISRAFDNHAIEDYLAYGYVPEPRSIYRDIKKLNSAHYLLWTVGSQNPTINAYWDANFAPDRSLSEIDAIQELDRLLCESVKIRLMSEVPLGAFLSGGVDSSAVVAYMADHSSEPVRTCAIGFNEKNFDESSFAKIIADRFHTQHTNRIVNSDDTGLIDTLVKCYDEPFADVSAIPTYRVCQLARETVTVALSGDGGDETFAGYRRYRFFSAEEKAKALIPSHLRRSVMGFLARSYPELPNLPRIFRAKSTLTSLSLDSLNGYAQSVQAVRRAQRNSIYSESFKSRLAGYDAISVLAQHDEKAKNFDPVSRAQYLDYKTYLPGDINVKVDRVSMAHSLEVREPLMDHKLIEFAARIPFEFKLGNGQGKAIFKKTLESKLPRDILYRQKMGFTLPVRSWTRSTLRNQVCRLAENSPLLDYQIVEQPILSNCIKEHMQGSKDHSTMLWTLHNLSRFFQLNG